MENKTVLFSSHSLAVCVLLQLQTCVLLNLLSIKGNGALRYYIWDYTSNSFGCIIYFLLWGEEFIIKLWAHREAHMPNVKARKILLFFMELANTADAGWYGSPAFSVHRFSRSWGGSEGVGVILPLWFTRCTSSPSSSPQTSESPALK